MAHQGCSNSCEDTPLAETNNIGPDNKGDASGGVTVVSVLVYLNRGRGTASSRWRKVRSPIHDASEEKPTEDKRVDISRMDSDSTTVINTDDPYPTLIELVKQ
jgi:hypothetical protein